MSSSCIECQEPFKTRKQKKYCSSACQNLGQYKSYIDRWIAGEESGAKYEGEVSNHVRRWLHEQHQAKCVRCGWGEVNPSTGKVPLTVNHIDGDWNRHVPGNLELLCPNCHSLTPNYGSLNRGRGRGLRLTKIRGEMVETGGG